MVELDRRRALKGAVTAAAGTTLAPILAANAASATAPAAGRQAPAFYRTKVGELEITQVSDDARTFPMRHGGKRAGIDCRLPLLSAIAEYVEKDGNGYRLAPVRWNPVI